MWREWKKVGLLSKFYQAILKERHLKIRITREYWLLRHWTSWFYKILGKYLVSTSSFVIFQLNIWLTCMRRRFIANAIHKQCYLITRGVINTLWYLSHSFSVFVHSISEINANCRAHTSLPTYFQRGLKYRSVLFPHSRHACRNKSVLSVNPSLCLQASSARNYIITVTTLIHFIIANVLMSVKLK